MAESDLPYGIIDIDDSVVRMTEAAVLDQLDAGEAVPLSAEAVQQLEDFLTDTFSFNHLRDHKQHAANFVWRLGIGQGMGRMVLRHADGVLLTDDSLSPSDMVADSKQPTLAQMFIRAEPDFLAQATPDEERAFWRLAGRMNEYAVGLKAAGLNMKSLRDASYVPPGVVAQARELRDATSTIPGYEPGVDGISYVKGRVRVEMATQNEGENELDEAGLRVILGAFVAAHGNEDDVQYLRTAAADFVRRTPAEATDLDWSLELIAGIDSLGLYDCDVVRQALQPCAERIAAGLSRLGVAENFESLPLQQLVRIAELAIEVQACLRLPAIPAFLSRVKGTLQSFSEMYGIGDPSLEVQPEETLTHQAVFSAAMASSVRADLRDLIGRLDEKACPPTIAAAADELRQGYTQERVQAAIGHIARELNPAKRAKLEYIFDTAVESALYNLGVGDALWQKDGLRQIGSYEMAGLSYFASGRRFLAGRVRNYLGVVEEQMAELRRDPVLAEHPDHAIALLLQHVYHGLWYARGYYAEGYETETLNHAVSIIADGAEYIADTQKSPGAAVVIVGISAGLRPLLASIQAGAGQDGREKADPLHAVLLGYAAPSDVAK